MTMARKTRRDILRGSASAGIASTLGIGSIGTAAAQDPNLKIDEVLQHDKFRDFSSKIPGLELDAGEATSFGNEQTVLSIPTNYGKLLIVDVDQMREVLLFSEGRVPAADIDWPDGVAGCLRHVDSTIELHRMATPVEKRQILSMAEIDANEAEDIYAKVVPSTGEIEITTFHTDDPRISTTSARLNQSEYSIRESGEVRIRAENVQFNQEDNQIGQAPNGGIGTQIIGCRGCDENFAADILYCAQQAGRCATCWILSPAPPVGVACWYIVCLGGSASLFMELLVDFGCTNLAACAYECLVSDWIDLW